jgi:hypothetical protein
MSIDLTDFTGPPAARDVIKRAGSVMLTGRNSGHGGRKPRQAAVQDLLEACAEYEHHTGMSIANLLPAASVLEAMLKSAPRVSFVTAEGRPFAVSFVQLHFPERGAHFLLSAGSGRKMDKDALQPVLVREAEMFRSVRPGLLFSKRLDRLGRSAWGFGELMSLVEATGAWMGDESGLHAPDEINSFRVFMDGRRGQTAADQMPKQTRTGMASRTDGTMVDGRASYHVAHAPPPGTVRLGMLGIGNCLGDTLLVLDSPAYLPDLAQVATGMPMVLTAAGEHVDQVANVRWVLSVLGRPEWSRRALVTELSRRSMSTTTLRLHHGAGATVQLPTADADSYPILDTILNNVELYESGHLRRALGVDGVDDVVIDNVMPTDAPWASPEDFARIRAWLARNGERARGRRSLSLSSLSGTLNGQPARLISSAQRVRGGAPGYVVRRRDPGLRRGYQLRENREPVITHTALARSIVEGIAAAGNVPLLPQTSELPEDRDLRATGTKLEARVTELRAESGALLDRLTQKDAGGRFVVGDHLLADLNTRYEDLRGTQIPEAERLLADAKVELEDRRAARGRAAAAGRSEDLLRLVESLRQPSDMSWSAMWLNAIEDFDVTTELLRRAGHNTYVVRWAGRIVFSELSDRWAIPFQGESHIGSGTRLQTRIERLVSELLAGIPFDEGQTERRHTLKSELAATFGVPSRAFLLGTCRDPRIIRTAARLLLDRTRDDATIAAEVDQSVAFVQRIREVYLDPTRRGAAWLTRDQLQVAAWHGLASRAGGVVRLADMADYSSSRKAALSSLMSSRHWAQWTRLPHRQGYRLAPCSACGGHRRAPMRIPEPIGLVCLDCRKDEAGLLWPVDPYGAWVCGIDLWTNGETA